MNLEKKQTQLENKCQDFFNQSEIKMAFLNNEVAVCKKYLEKVQVKCQDHFEKVSAQVENFQNLLASKGMEIPYNEVRISDRISIIEEQIKGTQRHLFLLPLEKQSTKKKMEMYTL